MKLTPVEPFSKSAPGFNHKAAREVYDAIMACPDDESAAVMTRAIVFDVLNRDIIRHGEFLSKAYSEQMAKRASDVKGVLVKQFLAKRMSGGDVTELSKAAGYLSVISKGVYDFNERSRNASKQRRSNSGRFVQEHTKIQYDKGKPKPPVDQKIFERLYGIPSTGNELRPMINGKPANDAIVRNYQLAYQQIADMVGPFTDHPGTMVHIMYPNSEKQVSPDRVHDVLWQTPQRPIGAAVSVNDFSHTGPAPDFYNMFGAMGQPRVGGRVANTVDTPEKWANSGLNPERIRRYAEANEVPIDPGYALQPGAGLFRRLSTGSTLLDQTFGDQAPRKLKAALQAGQWVGQYGPEAQRVLGPTAAKTAYRYRGVERKPDSRLEATFRQIAARMPNSTPEQRLDYALNGDTNERGKEQTSPFLQYWKSRLPKANLNTLQRMSGTIPPSEGILLDKKGKVVTQAVGYGDDWYLPFNLKNVNRMRGGSYIRTRTFGGPTTEDIYTALISGARSLTVVSHNGVYTMEFDDSFKGGRRYNDKAARMVARYGQLLDAVQSEKVTLDLMDPARNAELRQEAGRNVRDPDDPDAVRDEFQRLIRAERLHPKISAVRQEEIKQEVINNATEKVKTPSGEQATPEQIQATLTARFRNTIAADVRDNPDMIERQRAYYNKVSTTDGLVEALGLGDKVAAAEVAETSKIRRELSPLSLNGQGYNLALQSLQEQFPYYIKEPTYREWSNAGDPRDTGYIKPKHIRPEKALAGYFDSTVNGYSKFSADSLAGGHYRTPKELERKERETTTSSSSAPAGGGSSPAQRAAAASPAIVRDQADRELALHLTDLARNGNFSESAVSADLRGKAAADQSWLVDDSPGNASGQRDAAAIFKLSPDEIDEQIAAGADAFHAKLHKAVRAVQAQRLFDLDGKLVENSRRRGAAPETKKVDQKDPSSLLNRPDDEYDFGPRFEMGRHVASDLLRTFDEDNDIASTNLPSPTSADFNDAVKEKIAELRVAYPSVISRIRTTAAAPQELDNLNRQVLGVVKAKHIQRRLSEIPAEEGAVTPAEAGGNTSVAFVGLDPEVQTRIMGSIAPTPPPAIENTPQTVDVLNPFGQNQNQNQRR